MASELGAALAGQVGVRLRVVEGAASTDPVAAGFDGDPDGYRPDVVVGYQFGPGSLRGLAGVRWLHLTGTGVDHLEPAGLDPDVLVTTSSRVPVTAVAEYA